jgi:hypothetical protein
MALRTSPDSPDLDTASEPRIDSAVALGAVLVFAGLSLVLNISSSGFLEADGITHYLFARFAFEQPHLLTNVWGRPFVTALHALPANLPGTFLGQPISLIAVRAVSMTAAALAAIAAWRVAAGQLSASGQIELSSGATPASEKGSVAVKGHAALPTVFMLCMPMVILHSISELTELPFGLLLILAVWAYQRCAWWTLALLAGLLPAARPEGFGFAAVALVGLLLHRKWPQAIISLLPLLVWDRLGWALDGQATGQWWQIVRFREGDFRPLPWLMDHWPYSSQSLYEAGPIWKLAWMLPAVVGAAVIPFVVAGILVSLRNSPRSHVGRVDWIIVAIPLIVLVVHSLLHWLGKMGSAGDVRYLVAVAPFWALVAWRGWDYLSAKLRWRADYVCAALAGVVPLIAMHLHYPVVPYKRDAGALEAEQVVRWYEASDWRRTHRRLMSDHPLVWYIRDISPGTTGGGREAVYKAPPGSLYLWHEIYSSVNSSERFVVPPDLPPRHGWREVTPAHFPPGWRAFVTEPLVD